MRGKGIGYLQAIAAYTLWGIFPMYWRLMPEVNSFEVICHRIVWSLLTLIVCISAMQQWSSLRELLRQRKRLALCLLAALLISINWLVFIWAVQNKFVIESSLGYFINPLLTVVLAVVFFKERISGLQWFSIAIAMTGVIVMTIGTMRFPWIAVALATSFALYAAVKKKTTLPAISGLGMETAILAPIAVTMLLYYEVVLQSSSERMTQTWLLLVLGGPITTLPLVLFASAAKTVPLVAMGMLQYIGPTLQFLIGWLQLRENVSPSKAIGFLFVWFALGLFTWGNIIAERRRQQLTT